MNFTGGGGAGCNRLVSLPSLNIYFQTEHAKGKKKQKYKPTQGGTFFMNSTNDFGIC